MGWLGHVAYKGEQRNVYKNMVNLNVGDKFCEFVKKNPTRCNNV
jgi:hypothetical protein